MTKTTPTSYRPFAEARWLIAKLARRLGVSKTAVLELAVRKMDEAEKGDERS